MPAARRHTSTIARPRCPPCAMCTAATGNVAARPMRWTSTTCCSIPSCSSATIPTCWPAIRSSSATSSWTSIRTRTWPSTASCSSWPRTTSTSAWWATTHRASTPSAGRTSTISSISPRLSPARASSSWSRTTAPRRPSCLPPTASSARTSGRYTRTCSPRRTPASPSASFRPTATWRRARWW